ncbi:hypothetical protein HY643_03785 [Candidatus Woesearchaeota archaeon]|nr:hypothetical protein [Candidatus Woesearchaeota archaeon]
MKMTDLVACLSSGKGSWIQVSTLQKITDWRKIFLITNDFGREKFSKTDNAEFIVLDLMKSAEELKADLVKSLEGKIDGTEVALNIVSGTGKEHMALISALLSLGFGVRFVIAVKGQLVEI